MKNGCQHTKAVWSNRQALEPEGKENKGLHIKNILFKLSHNIHHPTYITGQAVARFQCSLPLFTLLPTTLKRLTSI